ncbi:MAG: HprK-related kinase A [Rhodocyclaceae bacterium]|nr:HprK-related kinase A [Rhodocyclaceae bacterium]
MTLAAPEAPLSSLTPDRLKALLSAGRFGLKTGPFTFRIRSNEAIVAQNLALLYGAHTVVDTPAFADFHVSIDRPASLRRWLSPQVYFRMDGYAPFYSLPAQQAFAMLEWGMNWCIASNAHQYLLLHAAVLAKDDQAIVMPAAPGSGKSTLCASLTLNGWRLLSDELAIIDPQTREVHGLARPVNLKNASIDVIQKRYPQALMNAPIPDTKKGTVSHLCPPPSSAAQHQKPAHIRWIMTPRYNAALSCSPTELAPRNALGLLIENAFNYDVLGENGFLAASRIVSESRAFTLEYGNLDAAHAWIAEQLK